MFATKGTIGSHIEAGFDPDAQAFFDAVPDALDATTKDAINQLVISAKANGWWDKCYAIYPMVGGTSGDCAVNLKSPGTYNLSFQGGWTFASTGATPNGTTGYADTGMDVATVFTLNDTHASYYSRTNTAAGSKKEWGVWTTADNNGLQFAARITVGVDVSLSDMYDINGAGARVTASNSDSSGYFMASRIASNDHQIYKTGSSIGSASTVAGALVSLNMFLAALSRDAGAIHFTDRECAFASFGTGISSTLAATMYTDIQTFQTSLSRQV